MKRCDVLLAKNMSRGLDAASKANMLPTYEGRERLYGTHSVESVLSVYAKHAASPLGNPLGGGAFQHPSRRGQPHLFLWRHHQESREDDGGFYSDANPTSSKSLERVAELGRKIHIPITEVPRSTLVQLCGDRRHQNVVLEVGHYEPAQIAQFPASLLLGDRSNTTTSRHAGRRTCDRTAPLVLFLDHIIDPMNLGNILRTSFFFGVRRVILSHDCCRCTPTVARASVGVLETLAISQLAKGVDTVSFLRDGRRHAQENGTNLHILAATAAPSTTRSESTYSTSLQPSGQPDIRMLVLGNEDAGLPAAVVAQCSHTIHVPSLSDDTVAVRGLSLNVNSACAVLLSSLTGAGSVTHLR
jgi:tRNA G18 (ribose-2'-O)-methylase SpoU